MQDNHLFDSDDSKQRGVGVDRLGTKENGIKLDWMWGTKFYKWVEKDGTIPQDMCSVQIGEYRLEVYFWHSNYEVALYAIDSHIMQNVFTQAGISLDKIYTRIDGQKLAEKLLPILHEYTHKLLKKHKLI